MGFLNIITKYIKVYNLDLGYISQYSRVIIDKTVKGGTINLKLQGENSAQGTPNKLPD